MLKPYLKEGESFGHQAKIGRAHLIFGNRNLKLNEVKQIFPAPCLLKQIHSDKVVLAEASHSPEADAQISNQPGRSLIIQTADCLPIMVVGQNSVAAIHAGWRGVEKTIVVKATRKLLETFGEPVQDLQIFIGPHIHRRSFEVGEDVGDQLLQSYYQCGGQDKARVLYEHPQAEKTYVDLNVVVRQQLQYLGIKASQIHVLDIDTYSSPNYPSYRQNKTKDRLISLVYLS